MTIHTKQGDHEDSPFDHVAPVRRANGTRGEVEIEDHRGHKVLLVPTFEAALEIEDALGVGVETLRGKLAVSGLPGTQAITSRELGVVLAAGARAAGDDRATADRAARYAWEIGKDKLRPPLLDFLWALCDGGRLRAEDLKKRGSSNDSNGAVESDDAAKVDELIGRLSDVS